MKFTNIKITVDFWKSRNFFFENLESQRLMWTFTRRYTVDCIILKTFKSPW
jgi:hypothetical protein